MLTEQEREWLERRKCTCNGCAVKKCVRNSRGLIFGNCEWFEVKGVKGIMRENFRDAAEFEARVASKLAEYCADYWQRESAWHALKDARIAVEQEMDGE